MYLLVVLSSFLAVVTVSLDLLRFSLSFFSSIFLATASLLLGVGLVGAVLVAASLVLVGVFLDRLAGLSVSEAPLTSLEFSSVYIYIYLRAKQ